MIVLSIDFISSKCNSSECNANKIIISYIHYVLYVHKVSYKIQSLLISYFWK